MSDAAEIRRLRAENKRLKSDVQETVKEGDDLLEFSDKCLAEKHKLRAVLREAVWSSRWHHDEPTRGCDACNEITKKAIALGVTLESED